MATWPGGKAFAFTIFDDTDHATVDNTAPVYRLLTAQGLHITKSVWPLPAPPHGGIVGGQSCDEPEYLEWVRALAAEGHEIAFHNASDGSSPRARTEAALDRFRELFGHDPRSGANHASNAEAIYCGPPRLGGIRRAIYNTGTRRRNVGRFNGEVEDSPWFWGDLCRDRVRYWRNFCFAELDTLTACGVPLPYHDPTRPWVDAWFAASEAPHADDFARLLSSDNLDQLEAAGGAAIVYTHFGWGGVDEGVLHPGLQAGIERVAERNGWFAPVSDVLDHLRGDGPAVTLRPAELRRLEWRWLRHKMHTRTTA